MDEFIYKGDDNILYRILINCPNENILTLSFNKQRMIYMIIVEKSYLL